MKWTIHKVRENGKLWRDYVSADGQWRIEEGRDEWERKKNGRPFALMMVIDKRKNITRDVGFFKSVRAAKKEAALM